MEKEWAEEKAPSFSRVVERVVGERIDMSVDEEKEWKEACARGGEEGWVDEWSTMEGWEEKEPWVEM